MFYVVARFLFLSSSVGGFLFCFIHFGIFLSLSLSLALNPFAHLHPTKRAIDTPINASCANFAIFFRFSGLMVVRLRTYKLHFPTTAVGCLPNWNLIQLRMHNFSAMVSNQSNQLEKFVAYHNMLYELVLGPTRISQSLSSFPRIIGFQR